MGSTAKRVLKEALQLPSEERAAIVARLLESLEADHEEVDDPPEVELAWQREIERRIREIDDGLADLVPWDVVRRELETDDE